MQRGRQIARQWKILRSLERARRGMTVGELHDAIDERGAPRTLYCDLGQIERAGFPLTSDEGRWRLLEMGEGGWSMPARPTEVLDEHFEPDPSFDAAAFSRQGFGVYHGKVHHFVIDLAAPIAHLIRERRYHQSQRVQERLPGVRLHMRCRGLPEVAAWVAGFGGQAVAREPPELCAAVERLHRKGLRAMAEEESAGPLTSDVNGGE